MIRPALAIVSALWALGGPIHRPPVAQATFGFSGTVVATDDTRPIGGVIVELRPLTGAPARTTRTASDGRFGFAGAPPGGARITYRRDGYRPRSTRVTVRPGLPIVVTQALEPDIRCECVGQPDQGRIAGRVTYDDGAPTADIPVGLLQGDKDRVAWARTDGDGRYVLDNIPPGRYRIEVLNSGFTTVSGEVAVFAGAATAFDARMVVAPVDQRPGFPPPTWAPPDVALRVATGGIYGFAADAEGGAVPGAQVTVSINSGSVLRQTVTNSMGRYHFNDLPPATYTVGVTLQGFRSTTTTGVRVTSGAWTQASALLALAPLPFDIHSTMAEWKMQPGDSAIRLETTAGSVGLVIARAGLEQLTCLDHGVWAGGSLSLEQVLDAGQQMSAFRFSPSALHQPVPSVRGMAIVLGETPTIIALLDGQQTHVIGRVVQGREVLERLRADVAAGRLPRLVPIKSISRVAFI